MRNPLYSAFPFEIYRLIAEQISDKRELISLSCVSPAMQIVAERLLYAQMPHEHAEHMEHFRDRPRLHPYVQSLQVEELDHRRAALLVEVLPFLKNLGTLRVSAPHYSLYERLRQCRFEQLKVFDCMIQLPSCWADAGFSADDYTAQEHLAAFLNQHPSIERLYWRGPCLSSEEYDRLQLIPKGSLPNLTLLFAQTAGVLVTNTVPSRPISHLSIGGEANQRLVSSLGAITSSLVSLDLHIEDPEIIAPLMKSQPQLRFLGHLMLDYSLVSING